MPTDARPVRRDRRCRVGSGAFRCQVGQLRRLHEVRRQGVLAAGGSIRSRRPRRPADLPGAPAHPEPHDAILLQSMGSTSTTSRPRRALRGRGAVTQDAVPPPPRPLGLAGMTRTSLLTYRSAPVPLVLVALVRTLPEAVLLIGSELAYGGASSRLRQLVQELLTLLPELRWGSCRSRRPRCRSSTWSTQVRQRLGRPRASRRTVLAAGRGRLRHRHRDPPGPPGPADPGIDLFAARRSRRPAS